MQPLPADSFLTIKAESRGLYKEKGSKFIAVAFPVKTTEAIKAHLDELKKTYFDARHHCYAYALGKDCALFRANDDGEPSSSAGKPILGQIYSHELTDILIVVVRYFGGKKLGVSGLIHAYKTAAADAIANATIITSILEQTLVCQFQFERTDRVMQIIKKYDLRILSQDYTERGVSLTFSAREILLNQVKSELKKITTSLSVK